MNLNMAICDDNINEINQIKSLIETYQIKYNDNIHVDTYTSSYSLLDNYSQAGKYHILFLDVEMPQMNGLDLARKIRDIPDKSVKIIFVSNYPEYMQDSFNVHAFHYLKKPLTFEYFESLIKSIIDEYKDNHTSKFVLRCKDHLELITMSDILYIESVIGHRDFIKVIATDGVHEGRGSIAEYRLTLDDNYFIAPHRSYLVNLLHVKFVYRKELILDDGTHIPLSRQHEKEINELFSKQSLTIHKQMY